MKTPAIIASLTIVGSIAYAAGSQGTAGKQPPEMPSGSQTHSMQEEMPPSVQMAEECSQGADKNWFTTGHLLPPCARITGIVTGTQIVIASQADVNGDGTLEMLLPNTNGSFGGYKIVADGSASTVNLISVHECSTANGTYSEAIASVLRGQAGAYFLSQVPAAVNVNAYLYLRDMDSDGDLDLIADASGSGVALKFWLENTGFQHTTPLAGDLDHDGKVNGFDLAILLANWQN
jgi:hypothetical protein